jgi:phosphoglucosamine mutase
MARAGVGIRETKVGDRYVLEEMLASGAELGGEQSGHIIFLRHATTGDGLLTAVRFLGLVRRSGGSVADVAGQIDRFPQVLENVSVAARDGLDAATGVWDAVRAAEHQLDGNGRVLVRPSGTEPLVRVMVEARSEEEARAHAAAIAEAVRTALA